jgi:hypothetical protein
LKAGITLRVDKWHQPRTSKNPPYAHQPKRTLVLLAFFMPRINAMRSYVTENKTLPIFPSWTPGSGLIRARLLIGEVPATTTIERPVSGPSLSHSELPKSLAVQFEIRGRVVEDFVVL